MSRTIAAAFALCAMLSASSALMAENERPFQAWTGCAPRSFGYFTGDRVICTFTLKAPHNVTFDSSRFPHEGDVVNGFEVRAFEEIIVREGTTVRRTFRYTLQAFRVFPRPLSVPFSPFVVIWTDTYTAAHKPIDWRVVQYFGPRIVVSQVTQADFVNELRPPLGAVVDDRSGVAWKNIIVGGALIVVGMAFLTIAVVMARNYRRNSPFLHALALLEAERDAHTLRASVMATNVELLDKAALEIFRATLRKKFALSGAPAPQDVYEVLHASRRYGSCAAESKHLWALGDTLLYENEGRAKIAGTYEVVCRLLARMAQYELV